MIVSSQMRVRGSDIHPQGAKQNKRFFISHKEKKSAYDSVKSDVGAGFRHQSTLPSFLHLPDSLFYDQPSLGVVTMISQHPNIDSSRHNTP